MHTYLFINPRSCVTIQDARTVSDEIEKGAKQINKYMHKLNYLEHINVYIALQYCLMVGKAFAWKALTAELRKVIPEGENNWEKGKLLCIGTS